MNEHIRIVRALLAFILLGWLTGCTGGGPPLPPGTKKTGAAGETNRDAWVLQLREGNYQSIIDSTNAQLQASPGDTSAHLFAGLAQLASSQSPQSTGDLASARENLDAAFKQASSLPAPDQFLLYRALMVTALRADPPDTRLASAYRDQALALEFVKASETLKTAVQKEFDAGTFDTQMELPQ